MKLVDSPSWVQSAFAALPHLYPVAAYSAEAAIYKTDGQVSVSARVPVTKDPLCVRAFRDEIALLCINEAQHQHPHAIHFKFNAPIISVDWDKQTVHAATEDLSATQVQ